MALQTRVLVSSINNLSDARYCAGMGADMLGFDLDAASENYLDPAAFKAITQWISGVQFVGELPEADFTRVQELLKNYFLNYLQVENTADWAALSQLNIPLICKITVEEDCNIETFRQVYGPARQYVQWFVLESKIRKLSAGLIKIIQQIALEFSVLLGFGIDQHNIKNILSQIPIQGIVLKGSHEIRPGFKDYDDLAAILEALETED